MSKDTISVLGGGWSAGLIDRRRLPGLVIAVNDSALKAPCRIAVTMDRLWSEARIGTLRALYVHGQLEEAYIRAAAGKNLILDPKRDAFVTLFENDHTSVDLAEQAGTLNGTNSGVCAINLAYQKRPGRIVLFGFDMNRSPEGRAYWYDDYPWSPGGATKAGKYRVWASEMALIAKACAAAGVKVFNASPTSEISAFPKIDPKEVLT